MKKTTVKNLEKNFDKILDDVENNQETYTFKYKGKDMMLIPYEEPKQGDEEMVELYFVNEETGENWDDEPVKLTVSEYCTLVEAADKKGMSFSHFINYALMQEMLKMSEFKKPAKKKVAKKVAPKKKVAKKKK